MNKQTMASADHTLEHIWPVSWSLASTATTELHREYRANHGRGEPNQIETGKLALDIMLQTDNSECPGPDIKVGHCTLRMALL